MLNCCRAGAALGGLLCLQALQSSKERGISLFLQPRHTWSVFSAPGQAEWLMWGMGYGCSSSRGRRKAELLVEGNNLTLITRRFLKEQQDLWGRSCLSRAGHGSALASCAGAVLALNIPVCSSGQARGAETQEPAPPIPGAAGNQCPGLGELPGGDRAQQWVCSFLRVPDVKQEAAILTSNTA